jgi:hypothetical protein
VAKILPEQQKGEDRSQLTSVMSDVGYSLRELEEIQIRKPPLGGL